MNKVVFSISKKYTRTPGPRYKWQGKNSGEHFLKTLLLEMFDSALENEHILVIDLDGTAGYGPSFLEESFGGLARIRNKELIAKHLNFISLEEPFLIDEIQEHIENAEQEEA